MAEYISREAAIETIKNLYPSMPLVKLNVDKWNEKNKAYMECETAIEALPAADVRPVVHGRWEAQHPDLVPMGSTWYCSNCDEEYDEWGCKPPWRFCPYCGARMDLEDDDD